MGDAATRTQAKVSVDKDVAAAFKRACVEAGVSMAAAIGSFMAGYASAPEKRIPVPMPDYSTRRRRRSAIKGIIGQMGQMKAWEEKVRDNMPENLQGSDAYDAAEEAASSLEEAIDALPRFWMVP